jgi:hypothetical protein
VMIVYIWWVCRIATDYPSISFAKNSQYETISISKDVFSNREDY